MANVEEFTIAPGRTISLLALDQSLTYEGLLLGVPTREMNQEIIDRLVASYLEPDGYGVPLILTPEQQPLDVERHGRVRGTPVALSSMTCVARFISGGQTGTDDIWSVLRVIWFQDDFAFPIDERVLAQFSDIDWDEHATGWEP